MSKINIMLLVLTCTFLSSCSLTGFEGSGKEKTESRVLDVFTSIELDSSVDVNVTFGETQSVSITGDDNLLKYIDTDVDNGKLVIDQSENFNTKIGITLDIVLVGLKRIDIDGSGDFNIKSINTDNFIGRIDGSGNITAIGFTNSLDIEVAGSGDVNMFELIASHVVAKINGSGDINVFSKETLDVNINGSGDVRYKGACQVESVINGSGSVRKSN